MAKKICSLILTVILMLSFSLDAFAKSGKTSQADSEESTNKSYTYWQDYDSQNKTAVYCKPMYQVKCVISASDMGADEESSITDVETDESGNVYVLDGAKSAIYCLNNKYQLFNTIDKVTDGDIDIEFKDAQGIYADEKGQLYIADTNQARIIICNLSGEVIRFLTLPDSELIPTDFEFKPTKITVDSEGYIYVAVDGSYYGSLLYSPQFEFMGFFGANTVKMPITGVLKQIWKKLTSNDIKRAADELSLPYTFTDIVADKTGKIYTATGNVSSKNEQTGQIQIYNTGGKTVKETDDINFGDVQLDYYVATDDRQNLANIAVDNNGFFYCLDSTSGRIFWYDSECELFSVFAGNYNEDQIKGTYAVPSAIALRGSDILVSAIKKNIVTVFSLTEYGETVRNARIEMLNGSYNSAFESWESVISQDKNNQMAYRDLAKICYYNGDNETAMEYAKLGMDRKVYADAFQQQRNAVADKLFVLAFGVIALVAILLVAFLVWKKKKSVTFINNPKVKVVLSSTFHPVEAFRAVKEQNDGSVVAATVCTVLFYISTVLLKTFCGFPFSSGSSSNENAFYMLLSSIGLIILWTVSNWLVCTLLGGIGKLKEIYIVTAYSLIPIIFSRILYMVLSWILTPDEGAFLTVITTVCMLYSAFILIVGMMRIHDYDFSKFIGTTILTVVCMMIIIFLLFLVFLISQQLFDWFKTLYIELKYR